MFFPYGLIFLLVFLTTAIAIIVMCNSPRLSSAYDTAGMIASIGFFASITSFGFFVHSYETKKKADKEADSVEEIVHQEEKSSRPEISIFGLVLIAEGETRWNILWGILMLAGGVVAIYAIWQILPFLLLFGFGWVVAKGMSSDSSSSRSSSSYEYDSSNDSGGTYTHPVTGEQCCSNSDGSLTSQGFTSYTWSTDCEGGTQTVSFTEDSYGNQVCTDSDSSQASSSNWSE